MKRPLALALLGLATTSLPARTVDAAPRFTIAYELSFLNLRVGEATLTLEQAPERDRQRYALDLTAGLRGLAGFFLDGTARPGSQATGGATAR